MSLLVAFTLTPLLASRWGSLPELNKNSWWGRLNTWFESLIDSFREFYTKVLNLALNHKRTVILIITGLILGSIALIPAGHIVDQYVKILYLKILSQLRA